MSKPKLEAASYRVLALREFTAAFKQLAVEAREVAPSAPAHPPKVKNINSGGQISIPATTRRRWDLAGRYATPQ